MATPEKWLIFPLEIVERELEGKLLIAQEAIKRGYGCIIGTKKAVREALDKLPSGLMILKSIIGSEMVFLQQYRNHGHKIACLDEEGLIQHNLKYFVSIRATKETMAVTDTIFIWGQTQYQAFIEEYPDQTHTFHIVSNPRADLWGKKKYQALYQEGVDQIKACFGDYFMIPTSFCDYNHFMGKDGAMSIFTVDNMLQDEGQKQFLLGYRDYIENIYEGFIDLIEPLSQKFPNKNIVIRPHPSENPKPWKEIAARFDNVHLEFEGNITPWLLGADAIIHCGSTTAVESHLLGKPVISYCHGFNDPNFSLKLPSKASINVTTQEEVFSILEDIGSGVDLHKKYPEIEEGHKILRDWIDNLDSYESAKKIMDTVERLSLERVPYDPQPFNEKQKHTMQDFKEFVWWVLSPLEFVPVFFDLFPFRIKQAIRSRRYGRSKTKDIKLDHLQCFFDTLKKINNSPDYALTELDKNLVALYPAPTKHQAPHQH